MALKPEDNLTLRAAALARVAPEFWNEFLGAFALYNDSIKDMVVTAPLAELPVCQGRAQATRHLTSVLAGAVANASKLESRK